MRRVAPFAHGRKAILVKLGGRLGFRQAIEAAEIAAVGHAHAQVAQDAPVRINQLADGTRHC